MGRKKPALEAHFQGRGQLTLLPHRLDVEVIFSLAARATWPHTPATGQRGLPHHPAARAAGPAAPISRSACRKPLRRVELALEVLRGAACAQLAGLWSWCSWRRSWDGEPKPFPARTREPKLSVPERSNPALTGVRRS